MVRGKIKTAIWVSRQRRHPLLTKTWRILKMAKHIETAAMQFAAVACVSPKRLPVIGYRAGASAAFEKSTSVRA
jgi:hypothetical protein